MLAASTFVVASGSTLPVSSAVGAMSDADLAQVAARMADPATGVPRQPCPSGPGGQTVQAFSDADAARWMLSNLANDGCGVSSPQDAAALGQRLVDARLVSLASPTRPATPQAAAFNPSDPQARHMFVSEAPAPPKGQALNAHYWWSPGAASSSSSPASSSPAAASARPAAAVAEELRRLILGLYGKYLSEDGRSVSYKAMGADPLFRRYVDAAAELQAVDLAPLSREELMCMFINLYNALIIHAHVAFGAPASALDRLAFFTRVAKYNIGGRDYSADDLENGVLRGNRPPASDVFALLGLTWLAKLPFGGSGSGDPRRAKVVDPVDPRIHFALVCGAKSCPPIQLYTPARLEAGLQAAAEVRQCVRPFPTTPLLAHSCVLGAPLPNTQRSARCALPVSWVLSIISNSLLPTCFEARHSKPLPGSSSSSAPPNQSVVRALICPLPFALPRRAACPPPPFPSLLVLLGLLRQRGPG